MGWIQTLRGGVNLSECDRVHLPVGSAGCHEKKKQDEEKKVKTIFVEGERKGREGSVGDDIRRVCHGRQHSFLPTGPGSSVNNTKGKLVGEKRK